MKTSFLLIAAAAGFFQGQPASRPPKAAPSVYVATKFGLVMPVPPGLSICPLPKNWTGVEDGTVVFLRRPTGCVDQPDGDSSSRVALGSASSITLRYRANSGRSNQLDGDIPAAKNSIDLASQFCAQPEISARFKLFGQPAVTCQLNMPSDKVRVVLLALYDGGSKLLLVSLVTTQERLAADERVLEKVAATITTCAAPDAKGSSSAPPCPKGNVW